MILQLCTVNDGDNVINKTLTNITNLNVVLKSDFDLDNPVILLNGTDYTTFLDNNYCVLPELNRSYFIDNIEQVNNRIVKLNCSCDVLETFKSDILGSTARFYRGLEVGDYTGDLMESELTNVTIVNGDTTLEDGSVLLLVTVGSDSNGN